MGLLGTGKARYFAGDDLARNPMWLTQNTGWGSHRAGHPPVESDHVIAKLVRMPPGQRSPWHGSGGWPELGAGFPALGRGSIYLTVEGEADFFAASGRYSMKPLDLLRLNALVYSYGNPGDVDMFMWTLRSSRPQPTSPAEDIGVWRGDPAASEMAGSHPYYSRQPPAGPQDAARIGLEPWDEIRRSEIDWHGEWGGLWGAYPPVYESLRVRVIRVPGGQTTDPLDAGVETILLGVGNAPAEALVGDEVFPLRAKDALVVPVDAAARLRNSASADVLVVEVADRGQDATAAATP